ncbi:MULTISPECIES: relaxase/mobilization nuclease domain-containing protein [unclassified Amycolatopsis]|uniref:relaxase/mobilization nuclease domain-containing protein n=1 Tax=unclassified Amycolatopsis TaxID=2618356 RepID=UPI0028752BB3|nr:MULTISPECIES: hypothetical protein [unclassified Amycolatopsis]MDS0140627.1 hypothetical protein [Amycolatopsis sp. 505]MDS0149277.1 hypothetical protein [Amycolatopsis sp. CM201R]
MLSYLYGPGKGPERGGTVHINPRTIASWDGVPDVHVPAQRAGGGQSIRAMARTIDLPARLAGRSSTNRTGHIVVANHSDDPVLSDEQWREIAETTMRRAGLWNGPDDAAAVRWIATRHDDNSIHITYSRVRENGSDAGYINYTRAWEAMRHEYEARFELVPTGRADGTSRRPYHQAEASRAKAEQNKLGGDPQALPDTAQLRHWCTVIALEASSEEVFVNRLRAAGITVAEQTDADGVVIDYRVGVRTDGAGQPVLYNLGKLAPELRLSELRTSWATPREDASAPVAAAADALEHAAASAPDEPSDPELAEIGHAVRDVLHAAAAYTDLGELRAAAEAAERASRLAAQMPAMPALTRGPAAEMARDLRTSASILLNARSNDDHDDDTAARIVLAVAAVLIQLEAWHELADRRAAAHAAVTARERVLEARRALTSHRPVAQQPATPRPGAGADYSAARTTAPSTPPDVPRRR